MKGNAMHNVSLHDAFVRGQSSARLVNFAQATDALLAPANEKRISIQIENLSGGSVNVNTEGPATNVNGFQILTNDFRHFHQGHHGDYATREFRGFSNGQAGIVWIIEVMACPCATGHAKQ